MDTLSVPELIPPSEVLMKLCWSHGADEGEGGQGKSLGEEGVGGEERVDDSRHDALAFTMPEQWACIEALKGPWEDLGMGLTSGIHGGLGQRCGRLLVCHQCRIL